MRRFWMALVAVVALSVGIAWAEGKDGHSSKTGAACSGCCCGGPSCAK
jgi:hypothetical protein